MRTEITNWIGLNDDELRTKIKKFLDENQENCDKGEIETYYQVASNKISETDRRISRAQVAIDKWDDQSNSIVKMFSSKYKTKAELISKLNEAKISREEWIKLADELEVIRNNNKNFNKKICFTNIRELLKENSNVKIGQIEKDAGTQLGYMSRLEKEGNTSDPSMEFIVTAAKLLNVSIDSLVSIDLTGITPTERYIVNFFDKLKSDTLKDKLEWVRETRYELDNMGFDVNGNVPHNLLSLETRYESSGCDYPDQVDRVVLNSKSFGPDTNIHGDCYNLRLKNGTYLYLMNIAKNEGKKNDPNTYAKEAWMYVPSKGKQYLFGTQDGSPIAYLLDELYDVVQERMEHPRINNIAMDAIDAFMNDDLSDDLPF